MNFFISFLIFLIILFLYIHIIHQLKTSEDLEIYEMDYSTNSQLQEVCEVKQPVLFEFQSIYPDIYENLSKEEIFSKYGSYDVKIMKMPELPPFLITFNCSKNPLKEYPILPPSIVNYTM